MNTKKILTPIVLLLFVLGYTVGCDTTNTDAGSGTDNVKLQFKTVSGSAASKAAFSGNIMAANDSLVIEGSNGTLTIEDIRFIVEEFKLEPAETDEEADSLDTENEEFEIGPLWVDLPLGDDTLSLGEQEIQTGLYEELEFVIEDLDLGEEEGDTQEHQALADSIRSVFPDWPDEASMVIIGSFTPTDGSPRPFKTFANAEIEIEREFSTPLEVTEDNMSEVLSIRINPALWFSMSDGSLLDLSQYDWEQTGQLLEFEAEFENGVQEIEVDEENDDD